MKRAILAVVFAVGCGSSTAPPRTPPAPKAPDFTLTSSEGQKVTLSALLQKGPVILAFFPKAFTGG